MQQGGYRWSTRNRSGHHFWWSLSGLRLTAVFWGFFHQIFNPEEHVACDPEWQIRIEGSLATVAERGLEPSKKIVTIQGFSLQNVTIPTLLLYPRIICIVTRHAHNVDALLRMMESCTMRFAMSSDAILGKPPRLKRLRLIHGFDTWESLVEVLVRGQGFFQKWKRMTNGRRRKDGGCRFAFLPP